MRRPHWLKRNAQVELPQHMVFVDTESNIEQISAKLTKHTLKIGASCYVRIRKGSNGTSKHEEWNYFSGGTDFWDWAISKCPRKSAITIFCHNWNYDAGILNVSAYFSERGWRCSQYVNDRPPFIVKFRQDTRTIRLLDTINYFHGSVASIGQNIGIPKLTMPKDEDSHERWEEYNKRDVEIIKTATLYLRDFISQYDLGNWQPTLASQAFSAYKHRFLNEQILIHDNERACELERNAYFGGRSECFFLGPVSDKLYYLDVNSMYPAIMQRYKVPIYLKGVWNGCSVKALAARLRAYEAIADVTINTQIAAYPTRREARLVFPIGRFRTSLAAPELRFALQAGAVERVHQVAWYETANIFKDYVEELYSLRQSFRKDNNATFAYLCKILLNSLYGKFGQNGRKWTNEGPTDRSFPGIELSQETPQSPIERHRVRLGVLQRFEREGESENSFPGIAAFVTSYGRMQLWGLIEEAGIRNTYYCDTDSLIVNGRGLDNLLVHLDNDKLGGLKLEAVAESGTFYGAKDYRFGDKEKHKGIRPKARKLGLGLYEQDRFYSWDYLINQGQDGYIFVEEITKRLHRKYTKGVPTKSGWVDPLALT